VARFTIIRIALTGGIPQGARRLSAHGVDALSVGRFSVTLQVVAMGIKFRCPNGHKLNVKTFLAGKRGICPHCGVKVQIPEATGTAAEKADDDFALDIGGAEGGVATAAVGTKSMADTVTLPNTFAPATTTPIVASVAPSFASPVPVGVAPQMPSPVVSTPVATAVMPAMASPAVAPVMAPAMVTPAVPAMPAATVAAPLAPSPYAVMPAAPVDPILEAPNAVWYVRPASGGQFGPARGDVMRKWLGEGRVSADSLVWRDGWVDWKPAAVVFPALGAPAGTPAAVEPVVTGPKSAQNAAARALRAKKRSNGMAIGMVITLGLLAIVLLVVFIIVLMGLNQG
jgi:hypothetical protein